MVSGSCPGLSHNYAICKDHLTSSFLVFIPALSTLSPIALPRSPNRCCVEMVEEVSLTCFEVHSIWLPGSFCWFALTGHSLLASVLGFVCLFVYWLYVFFIYDPMFLLIKALWKWVPHSLRTTLKGKGLKPKRENRRITGTEYKYRSLYEL